MREERKSEVEGADAFHPAFPIQSRLVETNHLG